MLHEGSRDLTIGKLLTFTGIAGRKEERQGTTE
jgi:hypothetical protein